MDAKEAFKAGFLLRCAEEGLDGPQIKERIKVANLIATALQYPIGSALATGVLGGAALGGAAGLMGRDDLLARRRPSNLQALQKAELTAAYLQQAGDIERRTQMLRQQAARDSQPYSNRHGI